MTETRLNKDKGTRKGMLSTVGFLERYQKMVKNAYKKGNTDNSVAFSSIFMSEKDAIRSFRAFFKNPTVERQGDAPP